MEERLKKESVNSIEKVKKSLEDEAGKIRLEDEMVCKQIGENALVSRHISYVG